MSVLDTAKQNRLAGAALPSSLTNLCLASADRKQDHIDWLRSARSCLGRVWATLDPRPFPLIVIAEDKIAPAKGFGQHGHRDVEVISYVISGALAHADSCGNSEILRRGEIQLMTAGRGIRHSECNYSATHEVHLLQIWVTPDRVELTPSYAHGRFATDGGLVPLSQKIVIWRAAPGQRAVDLPLAQAGRSWIHIVHGPVSINGTVLSSGMAWRLRACLFSRCDRPSRPQRR